MLRTGSVTALLILAGCAGPLFHPARGPTHVDRLVKAYPELRSGRFAVLADFEDPRQMGIVQLIGTSAQAKCVLARRGGRAETGGAGLAFTSTSSSDVLVFANTDDSDWTLRRDWRAYDLLLLSVHAPSRGLALDITVSGGTVDGPLSAESTIALDKGWNLLRLDLAEMGELVPLDDVREVRCSIVGASKPVHIRLDDVLLAGNREELLGSSRDGSGRLYVQRAGRRLNVGAGGRFELTFANGQVTHWYNLAADPNRLVNLVQGTTLGPMPVVVDEKGVVTGDFTGLGRSVVASQRLVEASPVRAVMECEWRFVDDPSMATAGRPYQRWRYTIYPTGQVYVEVQAVVKNARWSAPGLGLAVTLTSPTNRPWQLSVEEAAPPAPIEIPVSSAVARNPGVDSVVLLVPAWPEKESPKLLAREDVEGGRVTLVILGTGFSGPGERRWTAHLYLAAASGTSDTELRTRADEYALRRELGYQVGRPEYAGFFTPSPNSVLDQATGCEEVRLDQGQARLTIDGQRRASYSPAFHVDETAAQECWVYVDHLIHEPTARDADGDLVFQLPGVITKPTTVEVLCKTPSGPK